MGHWSVDVTSHAGVVHLTLSGRFSTNDMEAFVDAHNSAVDATRGKDYRVFCDLRELSALTPECAALFETAKAYSSAQANFRGSSVWVKSAVIALQHQRTSTAAGVATTELIGEDEAELWRHIAQVHRTLR